MHVVVLGASRGVAYFMLLDLLERGWTATVLLRSGSFPAESQAALAAHTANLTIVRGDAKSAGDVAKLFTKPVDIVVSTVGGTGSIGLRGMKLTDPSVCARSGLVLVRVLAELGIAPRVIVVSSMGVGDSHNTMPFSMRVVSQLLISGPHADKEGLEYVLSAASTRIATPSRSPPRTILSADDIASVPRNVLPAVIIVRAAFFTETGRGQNKLKANENLRTYSVSRDDLAHWIVDQAVVSDKWVNKRPIVGY